MPTVAEFNVIEAREIDHTLEAAEPRLRSLATALEGVSQPLSANCLLTYRAAHTSGTRPLAAISLIVMHSTEGDTAEGAARWFANPASQGSAHLVVDNDVCYRTLNDQDIPWGAPGANYVGFHIEQAGFANWPASVWSNARNRTLRRAAFKAALHCKRYGIRLRWLSAAQLRAGTMDGITDHDECSKAFGGNHYDPGPGWPRALFMGYVRLYYAGIKVRLLA